MNTKSQRTGRVWALAASNGGVAEFNYYHSITFVCSVKEQFNILEMFFLIERIHIR